MIRSILHNRGFRTHQAFPKRDSFVLFFFCLFVCLFVVVVWWQKQKKQRIRRTIMIGWAAVALGVAALHSTLFFLLATLDSWQRGIVFLNFSQFTSLCPGTHTNCTRHQRNGVHNHDCLGVCVCVMCGCLLLRLDVGACVLLAVNFPFGDLRDLSAFNAGPGKAVCIETSDGETLVGWCDFLSCLNVCLCGCGCVWGRDTHVDPQNHLSDWLR